MMSEMLTAKDIQELLQVDRSTVYRMAENGRLPAIKVGKQWRFPSDQIDKQFGILLKSAKPEPTNSQHSLNSALTSASPSDDLRTLLPLECVTLIQVSHAELLGVMLVITDMDGNPITEPSNPCGLFQAISGTPKAIQKCISSWYDLANMLSFEPQFHKTHLGMLCARAYVRVGTELKGMVIAGCVAPDVWPPSPQEVSQMAAEFDVEPAFLTPHLNSAYQLDEARKEAVIQTVQKVANIVAHIVQERVTLVSKLNAISNLAKI